MVTAARRHLTERYASGVDRLLWDTEKRLIPDLDAIRSVIDAASSGHAEALDIGAGLVLLQAVRLEVDRLEHDVFEGAHRLGMGEEAIAAVLDLPDAAAAGKRRRWLKGRRALPHADIASPGRSGLGGSAEAAKRAGRRAGEAADRAGRRAGEAADRAAEAARRRDQLSQPTTRPRSSRLQAERAAANAGEARVLADEAAERVALGLLRAADALDRCAGGCEQDSNIDGAAGPQLRRKADGYHQAAVRYREMAERYRSISQKPDYRNSPD
jgi:hypothetical protein